MTDGILEMDARMTDKPDVLSGGQSTRSRVADWLDDQARIATNSLHCGDNSLTIQRTHAWASELEDAARRLRSAGQSDKWADGFAAGIERAAKYHDDAARDCKAIAAVNQGNELGPDCTLHAADHEIAADEIRALAPEGAPAPVAWMVRYEHGTNVYLSDQDAKRAAGNIKAYAHCDASIAPLYAAPPHIPVVSVEPTPGQIESACLSYRHDFGILSADQRRMVCHEAREWLRAWQKEGIGADRNEIIERCAAVVDQANREGPYQAIAAASRIRALKDTCRIPAVSVSDTEGGR